MTVNDTWEDWSITAASNTPPGNAVPEIDDEYRNMKAQLKGNALPAKYFSTAAELSTLLTAIGSNQAVVVTDQTITISTNTTIPANVTLRVNPGGSFAIATGKTLTINGPIEAGPYQIFSCAGTGKVADNCLKTAYSEWWGAVADDNTDCKLPLNAAVLAAKSVFLLPGTYKSTGKISVPTGHELHGAGRISILHIAAADYTAEGAQAVDLTDYCSVHDFVIKGDATFPADPSGNIWGFGIVGVVPFNYCSIYRMEIRNVYWDGICAGNFNFINDNYIHDCLNEGILLYGNADGGYNNQIINNQITNTISWGIDTNGGNNDISHNILTNVGVAGYVTTDLGGIVIATIGTNGAGNNTVADNKIFGSDGLGIYCVSSNASWPCNNNQIKDNYIFETLSGIYFGTTSGVTYTGSKVTGNIIDTPVEYGIVAPKFVNSEICHNKVFGTSAASPICGINAASPVSTDISHNNISGFTASYGLIMAGAGISNVNAIGNIITGCAVGIENIADSDSVGVNVTGNNLIGCTSPVHYYYFPLGAGNAWLSSVVFKDNLGYPVTPAVPATTTEQQNVWPFPVKVTIVGGTVTKIARGYTSGALVDTHMTFGSFDLGAGEYIAITFSAAPTWNWMGM